MTNKPRAIGTEGENAIVEYLRTHGWPHAERRALGGIHDKGDITGTPGICWEVKWGKAAKGAGPELIAHWLDETERERREANATVGILVKQRAGFGTQRAGSSWAIVPAKALIPARYAPDGYVWMSLWQAASWLRRMGYGDPIA